MNFSREHRLKIRNMSFIALCTASICLSSLVAIPLPFSASVLTLQTVFINLTALCLKRSQALLSICLYVFMGAVGLPVFAGAASGPARLLSPVGGYYFGFIAAVLLMSIFKGSKQSLRRYLAVTVFIGIPVEHIFAVLFMSALSGSAVYACFMSISLPYLVFDVIKAVASSFIALRLNKAIGKSLQL